MKDYLKLSPEQPIFFTSDTHFGHRNIIDHCHRPFSSVEEMNEAIICNWNQVVERDVLVFHLGDFGVGGAEEWNEWLGRLNGRICLVMGNHDLWTVRKGYDRFESISMQMLIEVGKQKIFLCHYPFLCYSGANKKVWQLFGHVHTNPVQSEQGNSFSGKLYPTQYDVGMDNNGFAPMSFVQVRSIIRKQIEYSNHSMSS